MEIAKRLSFTASRDWFYRHFFSWVGLKSVTKDLKDGTLMHCWVPKVHKPSKPDLLLIHGFGANAMWQYAGLLHHFVPNFNVYVPDLVFFGGSTTTKPERNEQFQAECVMKLMELNGVKKLSLVGISYGGFVGYNMAVQNPEMIERLVLCCTGVCLEEKDMEDGLFYVSDLDEAVSILLPQTPEKLRELMRLSFVKPAKVMPSYFLSDFINVMCTDHLQEKRELIQSILQGRQISKLPRITQDTLILWGEQDKIFPLDLGFRLQRHIGDNSRLAVVKNAGHAVNLEKSKEFAKLVKTFLISPHSS